MRSGPGRVCSESGRVCREYGQVRSRCGRLTRVCDRSANVSDRFATLSDAPAMNRAAPHPMRPAAQRPRPTPQAMRPGSQAIRPCGNATWTVPQPYRPTAQSFRPVRICSGRACIRLCRLRICSGQSQCACGQIAMLGCGRVDFWGLMRGRGQLHCAAFDILWLNGRDLKATPADTAEEARRGPVRNLELQPGPQLSLVDCCLGKLDLLGGQAG
jgi:hypothetical protein